MFPAARTALATITMIYPEPGSSVTESRHLVLKLGSTDLTGVVITVNGVATDPLPVGTTEYRRAFRDFLILQPLWDKGSNQITVETFNSDKKLESFKSDIFFAPKGEGLSTPNNFRQAVMHQPQLETLCTPCHNMRPTAKQMSSAQDKDNPCFSCHKRMANMKFVHGPVGTYSCSYCHSLQGTPLYSTPKRDTKLCFDCHTEKEKEFKGFKFRHGPVAGGMCEICHDSHGSEYPSMLHKPIDKLCLSCHEQVAKTVHVTTLSDGSGHPISGKTDLSERGKGRELSCISCHNPHGGKARYYYVTGNDNKMALCQICHNK
jgi:predicted CXXCH cytochrome family protein